MTVHRAAYDLYTLHQSLLPLMRSIPHIFRCVARVVERQVDVCRAEGRPNSEEEKRLLEQLGKEADQWVKQALLLLMEVKGDEKKEEGEKDENQRKSTPAEVVV